MLLKHNFLQKEYVYKKLAFAAVKFIFRVGLNSAIRSIVREGVAFSRSHYSSRRLWDAGNEGNGALVISIHSEIRLFFAFDFYPMCDRDKSKPQ